MNHDFTNIEYLKFGNAKQRDSYKVLDENKILDILSKYDPILVGTIPISINVEGSDLDIVCYAKELNIFGDFVIEHFGKMEAFTTWNRGEGRLKAVVASFKLGDFDIELFGQSIPTRVQRAYRHMVIEHRLLQEKGDDFRRKVIALKEMGFKTEPAFAKLLGLNGDPYNALLEL
jgi:hypothetical protein